MNVAQAYLSSGVVPPRQGNAHLQIVPYQLFATADGYLVLNVGNDAQWQAFCAAADAPDLAADERFLTNRGRVEHRGDVVPRVAAAMAGRTTAGWQARLQKANVPHAVVRDYAAAFASPEAVERGMKVTVRDPHGRPVDLVGTPFRVAGAALPPPRLPPALGADTDAVLADLLGLDAAAAADLRERGVV